MAKLFVHVSCHTMKVCIVSDPVRLSIVPQAEPYTAVLSDPAILRYQLYTISEMIMEFYKVLTSANTAAIPM